MSTTNYDSIFKRLRRTVDDLSLDHPDLTLKLDDYFTALVVAASCTGSVQKGLAALTGPSNEGGIDAIVIDPQARVVSLFQIKYRASRNKSEGPSAITEFVNNSRTLILNNDLFEGFIDDLEPRARKRLEKARESLRDESFSLNLYFVTPWRISEKQRKKAQNEASRPGSGPFGDCRPSLTFLADTDLLDQFEEWEVGLSPPIPEIDLPILEQQQTKPARDGVGTYVFSVQGDALVQIYEEWGTRLFHQNIRGFLGKSAINKAIRSTIRNHPEEFWYLNNGLTLLASSVSFISGAGSQIVRLGSPQIINGQQTTRCLVAEKKHSGKTEVLVRLLDLSSGDRANSDSSKLVEKIVEATNSQNPVSKADLRSNDKIQVQIERDFAQRNHWYERKRGDFGPERPAGWPAVNRNNLLTASAVLEGFQVEQGVAKLWEDDATYKKVFKAKPAVLLARWRLWIEVRKQANKLGPEHVWAKNVAYTVIAKRLASSIEANSDAFRIFVSQEPDSSSGRKNLERAIRFVLDRGRRFYRESTKTQADRQDAQAFFKSRDVASSFEGFFNKLTAADKAKFSKQLRAVRTEIGGK